jgi:hypothetical protein
VGHVNVPPPYSRTPAFVLFAIAAICALSGLGLAFTIYGELALAVGGLTAVTAALLLGRSSDVGGHMTFQSPPGWPPPPPGWRPAPGWHPDPSWPEAPSGWRFWIPGNKGSREL